MQIIYFYRPIPNPALDLGTKPVLFESVRKKKHMNAPLSEPTSGQVKG